MVVHSCAVEKTGNVASSFVLRTPQGEHRVGQRDATRVAHRFSRVVTLTLELSKIQLKRGRMTVTNPM
jgi:hypothetical protein